MPIRTGHGSGQLTLIPAADQLRRDLPRSLRPLRYDVADVDAVMASHGVGDARLLLRAAATLSPADLVINRSELEAAAAYLLSPARQQLGADSHPELRGYRWRPEDLDAAMMRFGLGDARTLLRAAIAIDDGDRFIHLEELLRAGAELGQRAAAGYRFSPSVLADVMRGAGIASETALLAEARRHDRNHDRILSRDELGAAARVVKNIVSPHDITTITERIEALRNHPDVEVTEIGRVGDQPVYALRFAPIDPPPRLRALVTAGVHGNEPCGPGAAMLLVEQLLEHPELRRGVALTVVPLINPRGMAGDTRRNPDNIDLNRAFDGRPGGPAEVQPIEKLLASEAPDLVLDLHSGHADRNGFWILQAGASDLLPPAVDRFGERWPLLQGNTEPYDLTQPGLGTSDNPSTLKGLAHVLGARWSATLEAPGSVSYLDQVLGENELVHEILVEAKLRTRGVA